MTARLWPSSLFSVYGHCWTVSMLARAHAKLLFKVGLLKSPNCSCGDHQTVDHTVNSWWLSRFEGGPTILCKAEEMLLTGWILCRQINTAVRVYEIFIVFVVSWLLLSLLLLLLLLLLLSFFSCLCYTMQLKTKFMCVFDCVKYCVFQSRPVWCKEFKEATFVPGLDQPRPNGSVPVFRLPDYLQKWWRLVNCNM